ncbi:zinc-binding alcohol dehydrogenase family protein [Fictibacillus sp. KIGAM418]|uniref:Zinc-type alcohol dehydrogenase-like protein n=1 Tax=Fictibacillus marinisediminis TaxID=2878389 RepID=A0A9X1XAA1_9BACL|nr:zinc-binding alcohol dehydrogenase family protein [Fictibacillus marinisediminis]MCK6256833.1 zinc-binding alcohol dehydrogenase family protein [Fictibacillus marinisediminis]
MKAVGLYKYLPIDNPESLLDVDIDKPSPGKRDLLVKVKAISVNPVDTKVRSPKNALEKEPKILGWDVSGIVEETGSGVSMFKAGDEIYYAGSIGRPGGNSEFHLVDERIAAHKPKTFSFEEAAAMPLTSLTAWEGLFERLGIATKKDENEGRSILIIGAAGGVGSIALQLASWAGLTVVGTASRAETEVWAKKHGADYTISHYADFLPQLNKIGLSEVDYIFCLNSTDQHWERMMEAIAPQGKICSIVETKTPLNISLLQQKSVTFVMEFMFTRSLFETKDMKRQHEILTEMAHMFDEGILKTTLTETLQPIHAETMRDAHSKLESGKTIGKVVVSRNE